MVHTMLAATGQTNRNVTKYKYYTLYRKPTRQLARLVTSSAYGGAVPDHQAQHPNSTYHLNFQGPAVRCQPVDQDLQRQLLQSFNNGMNCTFVANNSDGSPKTECLHEIVYLSWVPCWGDSNPFGPDDFVNGILPLEPLDAATGDGFNTRYLGQFQDDAASVLIATKRASLIDDPERWDMLKCSLYNASYMVRATSDSNSRGHFAKLDLLKLNTMPLLAETTGLDDETTPMAANEAAAYGYMASMESLNRILVGTIYHYRRREHLNSSYYDEAQLTVQNKGFSQTLLPFTAEMLPFLTRWEDRTKQPEKRFDVNQWTVVDEINENVTVLLPNEALTTSTFNRSLGRVIEEMFYNVTLSLFSDSFFLKDSDEAINVTYKVTQNAYVYNSNTLFISYGIAVVLAFIASTAGCLSIYYSGASYSNRFSTILRTTRGQELEVLVTSNDWSGIDPLPRHLANTRIAPGRRRRVLESDSEVLELVDQVAETASEHTAMVSGPQSLTDALSETTERGERDQSGLRSGSFDMRLGEDDVSEMEVQRRAGGKEYTMLNKTASERKVVTKNIADSCSLRSPHRVWHPAG